MSYKTESFYLALLSNASLQYYPENTLTQFSNKLPVTLNLNVNDEKAWYMAITECSFTTIRTDNEPSIPKIKFTSPPNYELNENIIDILKKSATFFHVISNEIFFSEWQETGGNQSIASMSKKFQRYDESVYIYFTGISNTKFWIELNHEYTPKQLFKTIFSQIPKKYWQYEIDEMKNKIENSNATEINIENNENTKIVEVKHYFPNYVCISSDIIEPRIIGGTLSRTLLMYPMKAREKYNDVPHNLQIKNPQYCRIDRNCIADLNILITDETGEKLNLNYDDFSTMIVLHFQKSYIKDVEH